MLVTGKSIDNIYTYSKNISTGSHRWNENSQEYSVNLTHNIFGPWGFKAWLKNSILVYRPSKSFLLSCESRKLWTKSRIDFEVPIPLNKFSNLNYMFTSKLFPVKLRSAWFFMIIPTLETEWEKQVTKTAENQIKVQFRQYFWEIFLQM